MMHKKIPLIFGVPDEAFFDKFKAKKAYVAELRPGLLGIKITAKQLLERKIEPVIICDNMLAFCMKRGLVKDVYIFYKELNKKTALCHTGSLIAALCAKFHKIPVYLYKGAVLEEKAYPLTEIDGIKVTDADIKTYAPFFEEVPLKIVESM